MKSRILFLSLSFISWNIVASSMTTTENVITFSQSEAVKEKELKPKKRWFTARRKLSVLTAIALTSLIGGGWWYLGKREGRLPNLPQIPGLPPLPQLLELPPFPENPEGLMEELKDAYDNSSEELDLSFNNLTELPSQIGHLASLTELYLSGNQLTELPSQIGQLKNLTELYLFENQLTKLPPEIRHLKNLTRLDLSWNQFTKLPPEIGHLKNLTRLDLSGNQLTGLLPPEIGHLKKLEWLDLSYNELTEIPAQIGHLKNLTRLDLSRNKFTKLPPEIGHLENLEWLDLSDNNLGQGGDLSEEGLAKLINVFRNDNDDCKIPKNCEINLMDNKFSDTQKNQIGQALSKAGFKYVIT